MSTEEQPIPEEAGGEGRRLPPVAPWKKILLGAAAVSVLAGLALGGLAGGADSPATDADRMETGSGGPTTDPLVSPLGEGQGGAGGPVPVVGGDPSAASGEGQASEWSPFLVKGGFSFFVGFCIGYALRAFFKISAVALGLLFLVLFGMSYFGVVQVDWSTLSDYYDRLVARVREEAGGFQSFVTGSLPAAGLTAFGLVTGFRR